MKLRLIMYAVSVLSCLYISAAEPDILVTQEGESFKVYNLDVTSGDSVYYTLLAESNAPIYKISKKDILIIKKSDGTKIDPMTYCESSSVKNTAEEISQITQTYSPIIYHAVEDKFVDLKFNPAQGMSGVIGMKKRYFSYHPDMQKDEQMAKFILAADEKGSVLNFRLISDKERTLAVARPRNKKQVKQMGIKKIEYEEAEYSIPDYVMIGETQYSVVEIDACAFLGRRNIKNVTFPETLRIIGPRAFEECRLKRIILPKSIEIVGDYAFFRNVTDDFEEIHIPKRIKIIGRCSFLCVGLQLSPRGYTEAYLSSIPDFITTENCTEFGIDDNAVESYERRSHK